jgi:heme/copper-type cytochrome/quinol oxidase subunit 3
MFEEIPAPPAPPSQRSAIVIFSISFAMFLVALAIAWFRWSGPMSLSQKITVGEFIVGGVLSGVFLLTAKSTSREGNQKRMWTLFIATWILQLVVDVIR